MHVSYRWLARHVDLSGVSPDEIARDLTERTAEVEDLYPFAPVLSDVVVGHVVERRAHPGADKLSLCKVDVGAGELVSIVCGASNVAAGQRVAVARVGTALPGDVKIKKTKIRGEESCGMICSERELGLGDEHAGIWVLPGEARVGERVAEALGGVHGAADWVFEIDNKSLTHRPDCWGHRGLAAEIAALRGLELLPLDCSLPPQGRGAPVPVRIDSPSCFRYIALPIQGVRSGRSPEWLRLLLLAAGQRPLDLLVDVSNFVMLDLGQPNHIFDRRRLSSAGICVRDARAGETLVTLDGVERKLLQSDLLICSGDEVVALAGVMGGEASKVGADTGELLLEVATFHPTSVRRTAMRLGLRSDASARFEKHLDPHLPLAAAGALVRLLQGLVPGVALPAPLTDVARFEDQSRVIELRPERVRALLGVEIEAAEIARILSSLRFGVAASRGGALSVRVPSWRATKDVTIEEDLIEEVGRMYRYDKIPERPLEGTLRPVPRDRALATARKLRERLAGGARFHEVLSYSFLAEELARTLGIADEPCVEIVNPIAEGLRRVRRSVAPSLCGMLEANLRQRACVQLFEVGKGYLPEHADARGAPRQVHELALVRAAAPDGPSGRSATAAPSAAAAGALSLRRPSARFDAGSIFVLKGVVVDLLATLGVRGARFERPGDARALPPWVHPGRCMLVRASGEHGAELGFLAELEPAIARALGAHVGRADVALARLSIDALVELPEGRPGYRPIPRHPGLEVDVALALPEQVACAEVEAALARAGKELFDSAELFDVYSGERLGEGRRSLAFHVRLQASDRTLADADLHRFLERVARAAVELGGELRRE